MNAIQTEKLASNSFIKAIAEMQRGKTLQECSEELARVTAAVLEYGRPGKLKLELTVRRNGDGVSVEITDSIDTKVPKKERKSTNFFVGEDGQLSRDNPEQKELGFAAIQGGIEDAPSIVPQAVNG